MLPCVQGDEAFVKGDFEAAQTAYTQSLCHDTHNAVVWANRAAARLRLPGEGAQGGRKGL